MDLANLQQETLKLPPLRQGLSPQQGTRGEDGAPTWALHAPLLNQYFHMGRTAFDILNQWRPGLALDQLMVLLKEHNVAVSEEVIAQLLDFLLKNNLFETDSAEGVQRLVGIHEASRQEPLKWLLKNYLYFRVPLLRPDRFLERTLPYLSPIYSRWTWRILLAVGLLGLHLSARQWEIFWGTFQDFFNLKGLMVFSITLMFIKAIHKLGQAYAAKRQGCKRSRASASVSAVSPIA
ncbi:MAG: hypothetical protein OCC46_06695 [Pseudodesulfovibrio sp.]